MIYVNLYVDEEYTMEKKLDQKSEINQVWIDYFKKELNVSARVINIFEKQTNKVIFFFETKLGKFLLLMLPTKLVG